MPSKKKTAYTAQPQEPLDFDRLMSFTPDGVTEQAAEPPKDGMLRRYVGDTTASVARGAVLGVRLLADTAGADNPVSGGLRTVEDFIGSLQSASAKADQLEQARILKEAEGKGILDQVLAGAKAFGVAPLQTMAQAAGTSLPTIGAALIPGAGPAAVAARFAAPLALGAGQGAGAVKATIYDEVKQRALQEGRSPQEAELLAVQAQEYSGANSGQIALGAGLGAWAGKSGLESAAQRLVHGTGGKAAPGMLARVATGAVAEGIPEAAQGAQEKFAGNVAQTGAGFPTDPWAGVAASATMEGLAGHAMGGAMGIPNPSAPPVVDPAKAAADAIRAGKQPEGGPMTRAANAGTEAQAQAAEAGLPPLPFTPTEIPKPGGKELALAEEPDTTALDFEADPQFAGAMRFDNGAAPDQPVFASKQLADIHIGEQGALGELEAVEAGGGQWTVQQTEATKNRLARQSIEQWMAKAQPMPEERARALAKDAESQLNKQMIPLPMPDGSGWTVVPKQWVSAPILTDYMEQAVAAEQAAVEQAARADEAAKKPVERAPRTPKADPATIDLSGPATIGRFIAGLEATNTPAARAYVGDYRAGRISDAEVLARVESEQAPKPAAKAEPTPDERLAAAAAQAPKPDAEAGLILNREGKPFTHQHAAATAQKKAGGGEVLQVPGGWAVRPAADDSAAAAPSPTTEKPDAQAPVVPPAAAPAAEPQAADRASPAEAAPAAAGAAGAPAGAAPAVEAHGVAPAKPVMVGKLPDKSGFGASIGGLSTGDRRQLMVDPAGGYFWGEWGEASARDGSNPVVGKHASFTPAKFDSGKDVREAAAATPQSKTEPSGGNAQAPATPANAPEKAKTRRERLKAERAAPAPAPAADDGWVEGNDTPNPNYKTWTKKLDDGREVQVVQTGPRSFVATNASGRPGSGAFGTLEAAKAAAKPSPAKSELAPTEDAPQPLPQASPKGADAVQAPTAGPSDGQKPAATAGGNTVFTDEAAAAARARLKAKFAQQAAEAAAPAAAPMDVERVGAALQAAKLSTAETSTLEAQYGAKSGTEPFMAGLVADVVSHVTKGAESVARAVRSIVGKVAKAILSIAVVFNVAGLNPQFSSESYARTVQAMPRTVTVTETVQLKQAGKADLNGRELSPAATKVVNWIGAQNRPSEVSLVLDPGTGRMYAMRGGKIEADAPALYGKQGVQAISDKALNAGVDETTDDLKVTPAGRFPLALEKDSEYGTRLTFLRGKSAAYAIHRVYLGDPKERRQQRLDSTSASDNAVSYGCVNVGNDFYDKVLRPLGTASDAYAYLIPSDTAQLDALVPMPEPLTATRTTTFVKGEQFADAGAGERGGALFADRRRGSARQLSSVRRGLDPETMMDGITLAGYHIEKGARTFAAYARAMVEDLGDGVKPYLQSWYMAVRADPRAADFKADMDKAGAVEDLDVDEVLATPAAPAEVSADARDSAKKAGAVRAAEIHSWKIKQAGVASVKVAVLDQLYRDVGAEMDGLAELADQIVAELKATPTADPAPANGGAATGPESETSAAAGDTAQQGETPNERPLQGDGAQALDGVAAEQGGSPEGGGAAGPGAAAGGKRGTRSGGRTDGAGVSAARGGRSGAEGVHPAGPGAGSQGDAGAAGRTRRKGKPAPETDAVAEDLFSQPAATPPAPVIPASNFVITPDLKLGQGGEAEKFRDNLAAIRTLKTIERENRRATADEQRILARYVGWGGIPNAFPNPLTKEFKPEWKARGEELRDLLTPKEHRRASNSTTDAHYTSETVTTAVWDAVRRLGFRGGLSLEMSMGTGNFLGLMPEDVAGRTKFIGVELDSITARIAKALYPQSTVLESGMQYVPLAANAFDLDIGNPPFGDTSLTWQYAPGVRGLSIHNQFFVAGLNALKPGGIQAKVVSRYLMDAQDMTTRKMLAVKGKLLGAIRLPETAFKTNARTQVVTDIVFIQRRTSEDEADAAQALEWLLAPMSQADFRKLTPEGKERYMRLTDKYRDEFQWIGTTEVRDPLGGEPMRVSRYFAANPDMVVGTMDRSGSMQHGADVTVKLEPGADFAAELAKRIERLPEGVMDRSDEAINAAIERHKTMADALEIAVAGLEPGQMTLDADGKLMQVFERETPEGDFEMGKREITAASPWSPSLFMDGEGRWYRQVVKLDEQGKPVKALKKDGTPGNLNVYEREVFGAAENVPESLRLGETKMDRLRDIAKLRDLLKRQLVLESQDDSGPKLETARAELAAAYDAYVAKHGFVSEAATGSLVNDMPDGALVQALELSYRPAISAKRAAKTGEAEREASAKKAPILSRRVVVPYAPPGKANSAADAMQISLSERGFIDVDRIAQLRGLTSDEATAELTEGDKPLAFYDPEARRLEPRDVYLTGEVARKLRAAREAGMARNVEALEAVQPEPITSDNVTVILGSSWVPPQVYADFAKHLTGEAVVVKFEPLTNTSTVRGKNTAKAEEWAARNADGRITIGAIELLQDALNSQASKVYYPDGDDIPRLHKGDTELAALKRKDIEREFAEWVFADGERRRSLVAKYNEKFNTRVVRQYDGSHLTLPGKVPDAVISLRRHQKNAIWRGISERFMLYDHVVGAGKTFTAIARVMERRRMGLSRKPMIVVPNHMVEQFAADVYRLYPGAKVLAAGKKDFEKRARRRLFGKIATGDWDVVIVPHSSFQFIGLAPETEEAFLGEELRQALEALKDAEADQEDGSRFKSLGVKQAERLVKKIEARIDAVRAADKDRLLTFEQMGVDDITVDEAHEFKNLFYSSRLENVRGMGDSAGSAKAFDLYTKIRYLRSTPTGSVVFMTGTPISNSAVEMFTMMRYLAADALRDLGLEHFDAWRTQYVDASTAYEQQMTGGVKPVGRLGRTWGNARSLMDLYYSFTDAVTIEDIKAAYREDNPGKEFPLPKVKGGGRQQVVVQPTSLQVSILKEIFERYDALDEIEDIQERNSERLRLMDAARKISLDPRAMTDRSYADNDPKLKEPGKLDKVADEVARIYQRSNDDRGTQLIFLDRSVPKSKSDATELKAYDKVLAERDKALEKGDEDGYRAAVEALDKFDANAMEEMRRAQAGGWNAYQQIKDNLIARGIPAKEIRFIQEAANDEQKQAMFDAVKAGDIRVLIGSTPRMGAGTNVQDRLVALHHVDVTWKPSDIEQREGRIIRQGNLFATEPTEDAPNPLYRPDFEVEVLAYATERTSDASLWALNGMKLKTINGIRKYDGSHTMEFEDEDSLSMAQMAAMASGDPLMLERIQLVGEIDRLERMESSHRRRLTGLKDRIDEAQRDIEQLPGRIDANEKRAAEVAAWEQRVADAAGARTVTVEGKTFTGAAERFEAAKHAMEAAKAQTGDDEKAKFAITIDGKRITSNTGIENAIADALGDSAPFEATIFGEKQISRAGAVRAIVEKARALAINLDKGQSEGFDIGDVFGLKLEGDVSRNTWDGGYSITFSLLSADGRTLTSQESRDRAKTHDFSVQFVRATFDRVFSGDLSSGYRASAGWYRGTLKQKTAELPELERQLASAGPFKQADELAQKRQRLEEVTQLLSGAGKNVAELDEMAMLFGGDPVANTADVVFSRGDQGAEERGSGRAAAVEALVRQIAARWANAPEVVVVESLSDPRVPEAVRREDQKQQSQGASGQPEGFFYGGKVYLVAPQLGGDADVVRVLFHEALGHYGLRGVFGQSLGTILDRVAVLQASKVRAKAKQYGLDFDKQSDRRAAAEEVLAELAQTSPTLGWGQKAIAAVRTWLRQHIPGFRSMALTDAEIVRSYILPARAFVQRGGPGGGGGVRFSRSNQTNTGSFRRWFGDSKVVDAEGKPLVVYHGTFSDFDRFDSSKMGANVNPEDFGFFFTNNPIEAGAYADPTMWDHPGPSPNVMPVYLSIKNPKFIDITDEDRAGVSPASWYDEYGPAESRSALDEGHDGLIISDLSGDPILNPINGVNETLYVAFEPEQIKSAIGNSGDFDPASSDIRFSRGPAADTGKASAQDLIDAKGGVFDFNRLGVTQQDKLRTIMDGSRPFWLGALTRDQLADVYGKEIPPVKEYDDLTRAMENERSKIAQDADDLYNEWAKLPAEVNDRLARVMLDATVYSVHPDKPFGQIKGADNAKREAVHRRLVGEWDNLPDGAKSVYEKVKQFHMDTLTQLRDGLEARIKRQVEDGQARAAALTKIRATFDSYLTEGPYFPLSRFGDFLVVADRADGERVVASYATAGEQAAAARTLEADGFTVKLKTAKTYSREMDGAAGKFIGDVLMALGKLDMKDATVGGAAGDLKSKLMDDVNQLFIKALPDLSYRKHFAHRKNVPGFSSDMMRGFASSSFHAASHIARVNHGDRMTFALQDAYAAIEGAPEGDFNLHSQVLNELTKRHEAALNPNTHPVTSMLNQVGFVMYLGLSPAAGIINMLQTVMVTMPHLGARYGFGKANGFLAKALADITTGAKANTKNGWNAAESAKLTDGERAMMRELQDEGVIDLTQAHDLASATGLDSGNVARSKAAFAMARAMKIVGWTFHIPEVMNRQVTALSAYRLEMEKSGDGAAAKDAAREAIKRTHFDYSASNRARFMQGNVARVALQFKQYSQNMTYLLGRALHQALKGESPEVRRIAKRQLVATLGVTWAMAGTLGLPGIGAVAGLIAAMIGAADDDDEPYDWKVEFRNLMADTFGKEAGEVLSHGIPRALMPWDISNRVGLGDLWFRDSGREGQNPREAFAADAVSILGPTAGTALGLYTAADHMRRGNWTKATESLVPKFLRDPIKALREGTEGVTTQAGNPLMELTGPESIGQLLGFTPARKAEMFEGRNAVMNAKAVLDEKRQALIGQAVKARTARDTEEVANIAKRIAEFNQRNPEFKISPSAIIKAMATKRKNAANTQDGVTLPKTKDGLRDIGRFAVAE